jgi:hypothetical protein
MRENRSWKVYSNILNFCWYSLQMKQTLEIIIIETWKEIFYQKESILIIGYNTVTNIGPWYHICFNNIFSHFCNYCQVSDRKTKKFEGKVLFTYSHKHKMALLNSLTPEPPHLNVGLTLTKTSYKEGNILMTKSN